MHFEDKVKKSNSSSAKQSNHPKDSSTDSSNTASNYRSSTEKSSMNQLSTTPILKQSEFYYYNACGSPVVIKKHKLIWCLVLKAGSTSILDLLFKLQHLDAKSIPSNRQEVLHHLPKLSDYSIDQASDMILDPEWTKVITIRDPKTRFLSAYLGKEIRWQRFIKPEYHLKYQPCAATFRHMCCIDEYMNYISSIIANTTQPDCWEHKFTFAEFINATKECHNIHWKPHVDFVANHLEFLNFIIDFNNLASDTERLLKKFGVWSTIGATGWGENGTDAVFRVNDHHHSDSGSKYYEFYTPYLEKIVEAGEGFL